MAKRGKTGNLTPWEPGQSGNPAGRPEGALNRTTIIRKWLEAGATDGGEGQMVDQITRALIRKAANGDVAAFRELMDSAYGKVKDESEVGFTYNMMPEMKIGGKPMEFKIGKPAPRRE